MVSMKGLCFCKLNQAYCVETNDDLCFLLISLCNRQELETRSLELSELEVDVDNTTQRISLAKNSLATLRNLAEALRNDAGDLKNKATKLQEANVEGKYFGRWY